MVNEDMGLIEQLEKEIGRRLLPIDLSEAKGPEEITAIKKNRQKLYP